MLPSIVFIICTEPGILEKQSLLLVESLRNFGGSLKDVPVYSFQPRRGKDLSKNTLKLFEDLQVCHQKFLLNVKYPMYGVANKPFACAYAEETIDADILVFLDSDQCFFSSPNQLLLSPEYDVAVRPEDLNLIGSKGKNEKNEEYWSNLYRICQTKYQIFVNTTVDNQKIRAYWNSGLVAVRSNRGIFTAWRNNFEKVMELGIQPERGLFFVEQSVLSATICSITDAILTLPMSYNYPLNLHWRIDRDRQIRNFDNLVSVHYHKIFREDYEKGLDKLNLVETSTKYQWLYQQLEKQNLSKNLLDRYITRSKKKLYQLIKYLRLNQTIEAITKRPLP